MPSGSDYRFVQGTLVLILGLFYVFWLPLFEAPDEPQHFMRAFALAEGQFVHRDQPRELGELYLERMQTLYPGMIQSSILQEAQMELDSGHPRVSGLAPNTSVYSFVPYLFHAAAIKAWSVWRDPVQDLELLVYLCRLVSLWIFVFCFGLALYLAPGLSWPLFWLASTPMVLAQSAIVGLDGIVLGCVFLFLTAPMSRLNDYLFAGLIFLASLLLFQAKFPYLPVVFLSLVLIYQSGQHIRFRAAALVLSCLLSLGTAMAWMLASREASQDLIAFLQKHWHPAINPSEQLVFILTSPLKYSWIMLTSLYDNLGMLAQQFVGVLGWLSIPIDFQLVWVWLGMGIVSIFLAGKFDLSLRQKIFIFAASAVVCLLTFALVLTSMYLICDPVKSASITMQGRYFHPVAAMFLTGCAAIIPWKISRCSGFIKAAFVLGAVMINARMLMIVHAG